MIIQSKNGKQYYNANEQRLICLVCESEKKIEFPIDMLKLAKTFSAFEKAHKNC